MPASCPDCVAWKNLSWPISKGLVCGHATAGMGALAVLINALGILIDIPAFRLSTAWQEYFYLIFGGYGVAVILLEMFYFWPDWYRRNWLGETIEIAATGPNHLHVHRTRAEPLLYVRATVEINLAHRRRMHLQGQLGNWQPQFIDEHHIGFTDAQGGCLTVLFPTAKIALGDSAADQADMRRAVNSLIHHLLLISRYESVVSSQAAALWGSPSPSSSAS